MPATPAFQRIQQAFCAHLRDPRQPRPAGIEARRMAVYRDLFFKNIQGLLRRSFPATTGLLEPDALAELADDFFARHGCRTPYFHRIGAEFVAYLARPDAAVPEALPFLPELARYEWAETCVRLSAAALPDAAERIDRDGDLLDGRLAWTPHLELCTCAYPVHRIRPGRPLPRKPDTPTFLLVFRTLDDRVRFLELSPASARLVALLHHRPDTPARTQLQTLADELGRKGDADALADGQQLLHRLRARGAILGVWPPATGAR